MATNLNGCPYRGLDPYKEVHQEYFFGRERDTERIASNLFVAPLTVLYGSSGVGKSSVLQAGAIPHLRENEKCVVVFFGEWQADTFNQALKKEVLQELTANLNAPPKNATAATPPGDNGAKKITEESILQAIGEALQQKTTPTLDSLKLDELLVGGARAFNRRLLIIFDQFEEYFLYHAPTKGSAGFDAEFARAVNQQDSDVNFMLAMREEELSKLDRFKRRIPTLLSNLLRLDHLDHAAARNAIEKPLTVHNTKYPNEHMSIEPGLVEEIIRQVQPQPTGVDEDVPRAPQPMPLAETGTKIETPFLQLVLVKLWQAERDRKSSVLQLTTFQELGGAKQIARDHLDAVMGQLTDQQRAVAAPVLRFLVTPKGSKIALDPATLAGFANQDEKEVEAVLILLSIGNERILRKVNLPGRREEKKYELFHDVLGPAILDWRARYMHQVAEREAALKAELEHLEAQRQAQEKQLELERATAMAEAERRRAVAEELRALEHSRSAQLFRRLTYALGLVCIIAIVAVIVASVYVVKAKNLRAEGLRLKDVAAAAQQKAADAQKTADSAQKTADRAAIDAEVSKIEADSQQRRADAALAKAAAAQAQANHALSQVAIEKRNVESARKTDQLYREAFALSRRTEGKREAINKFLAAVPLYEQAGAREAVAATNVNIGEIYRDLGEGERAEEFFNQALEVYRGNKPDPVQEANTLNNIALVYINSESEGEADEDFKAGTEKLRRALTMYREQKNDLAEAASLVNMGDIHLKRGGNLNTLAEAFYSQAIVIFERVAEDKKPSERHTLATKQMSAFVMALADNIEKLLPEEEMSEIGSDQARALYFLVALEGYKSIGDDKGQAAAHLKLAQLYESLFTAAKTDKDREEPFKETTTEFNEAAASSKRSGDSAGEATAYARLGDFYQGASEGLEDDDLRVAYEAEAERYFKEALKTYQNVRDRAGQIFTYKRMAQFYGAGDSHRNTLKAVAALNHAIDLYRKLENSSGQVSMYMEIGRMYHADGKESEADAAFQQALAIYPEEHDPSRADTFVLIARIHRGRKTKEGLLKALGFYEKAAEIYQTKELRDLEAPIYATQASINQELARLTAGEERKEFYQKALAELLKQATVYEALGRSKDRSRVASIQLAIARVLCNDLKDSVGAGIYYNKALTTYQQLKSPIGISNAQKAIQSCQGGQQKPPQVK